jgi:hypothetical protein
MTEERRSESRRDRRRRPRGGRRPYDNRTKPWYLRRRLWLAAASLMYVAWQRMRSLGRRSNHKSSKGMAA